MKREDIRVGEVYANGDTPPLLREVIVEGPQYAAYPEQEDRDCVGYRVYRWHKKSQKYRTSGNACRCTRVSFAAWAKRAASETEKARLHNLRVRVGDELRRRGEPCAWSAGAPCTVSALARVLGVSPPTLHGIGAGETPARAACRGETLERYEEKIQAWLADNSET